MALPSSCPPHGTVDHPDAAIAYNRERLKALICTCPCVPIDPKESSTQQPSRRPPCACSIGSSLQDDGHARETLDRTINKMEAAIRATGAGSPDALLTSRRLNRSTDIYPLRPSERVFQVIGAIIYEMEWTSDADGGGASGEPKFQSAEALADVVNTISPHLHRRARHGFERFFRVMLAADYGFTNYLLFPTPIPLGCYEAEDAIWDFERLCGFLTATAWRWRQGHAVPDQAAWDFIIAVLTHNETLLSSNTRNFPWDAAVMLYRYHSRRVPISPLDRARERTGYPTGLVQEMVAEIPTRGNARLERKLSLDVHSLFPLLFKMNIVWRMTLNFIAWNMAHQHGCRLRPAHRLENAAPKTSWLEWFNALLGLPPNRRIEDEESRGCEEKLVDRWEEEEKEESVERGQLLRRVSG